jgi:hypothetical protein
MSRKRREYFSTLNKNEVLSFAANWMELEDFMLNEIILI